MFQDGGAQTEHVLLGQTEHVLLGEETVELVLNEGSDLEDFSENGSEENTVDSGKEFVPVDLKTDLSDSDNNIFIFITGICATCNFLFCLLCLDSSCFAVATEKGI